MSSTPNSVTAGARYRHLRRGSEYTILGTASLQIATGTAVDGCDVVLYGSDDYPQVWAREIGEFMDGRFERIADAKTATPDQPQAVPDMVLVPREPTQAMQEAVAFADWMGKSDLTWDDCWRIMLAARPVLPVETPAEGLREALESKVEEIISAIVYADNEGALMDTPTAASAIVEAVLCTAPAPLSGRDGSLREALGAIRSQGWMVGVHNDYRLAGELHTFWLFTHADGRWLKGEGKSDDEALAQVSAALAAVPPETAEMNEGESA